MHTTVKSTASLLTLDERECVKLLLGPCMTYTLTHTLIYMYTLIHRSNNPCHIPAPPALLLILLQHPYSRQTSANVSSYY